MTSQVAACANHPRREAIGICVLCRTRVCSECATKVDGINYCVSCLASLAARGSRRAHTPQAAPRFAYASAGAYCALLGLLVWLFLEVMMPGVS